jgi:hypothetical protein
MFYWLDSFTQCLPPLFRHGEFKPHLLHHFLAFYVNLTKWPNGLTGRPGTVSRPTCLGRSCGLLRGGDGRGAEIDVRGYL